MKKIITLSALLVVLGISFGIYNQAYTSSSGSPGGRTGGPGDSNCNSCHTNTLQSGATGTVTNTLTFDGAAATSYTPGTSYTLNLATTGGTNRHGFEIMVLNSSNTQAGTFTARTGNRTVVSGGRTRLTHSTPYSGSMTFTWVAPAAGTGNVTFYAITFSGNGNGSSASILRQSSWTLTEASSAPPAPTITASGPLTFCAGGNVTLTSSAATTYLWSTGETTRAITTSQAGSYTVQVANGGPLSPASAATVVSVNLPPNTPTITASGALALCFGRVVTLTSSSATGNLWSNNATTNSITVSAPGVYTVRHIANGCTSLASNSLAVTATSAVVNPFTASFCAGNSYNFNGRLITTPGNYRDTLVNNSGCDSLINILTLSIASTAITSINAGICAGATYTFGTRTLNQAGVYSDTIRRAGACDSVINLNLTVTTLIAPTIQNTDGVLSIPGAFVTGTTFKWYKDGVLINGAIAGSYTPTVGGSYTAKVVTADGCEGPMSAAIIINSVNRKYIANNLIRVYPNPTQDNLSMSIKGLSEQSVQLQVMDNAGKIVLVVPMQLNAQSTEIGLPTSALASGNYIILGIAKEGLIQAKFIKK